MSEKKVIKKKTDTKKPATKKRGKRAFRIGLIVLLSLLILVIGILFAAYLILNHFTGKIKYVGNEQEVTMASNETLSEEETEEGTNSPQDVVFSFEDILNQLQSQLDPGNQQDPTGPQGGGDPDKDPTQSQKPPIILPEVKPDENVFNILLVGVDTRSNNNGGRSDAMMLLSINKKTKQITLTSFLRDMYVAIPGRGNNRLNAAHAYGGAPLLLETIKLNFGVTVDYFARVNFYSFVSVVDAAGGVDINVDSKELPYVNGYLKEINRLNGRPLDTYALTPDQTGRIHLNGSQALAYARIRYVGSDYARTERQREVIFAVVEQMKKMSIFELTSFLNVALPQLTTNLSQSQVNSFVLDAPSLLGYSMSQSRIPVDGSATGIRVDGKSVIAVDLAMNRNYLNQILYGR